MDKIQIFTQSLETTRHFFQTEKINEVLTPPAVENPGMEPHLHPFQLNSPINNRLTNLYLHTSPEFWMKWILSNTQQLNSIYTLSYCFRDEPKSEWHRNQFLMLEWYRKNADYEVLMDDCEKLLSFFQKKLPHIVSFKEETTVRKKVKQLFQEIFQVNLDDLLTFEQLQKYLIQSHSDLSQAKDITTWDDLFFLLFLNKVEPTFHKTPSLIVYEYPAQLAALSKLNKNDPRYCNRFEWYLKGVEVANCFDELTDLQEQKNRASQELKLKKKLYGINLPEPQVLYSALEQGLPKASGIALGFERFIKLIVEDYDFVFLD